MNHSWEQLELMFQAHRRLKAEKTLMMMVGCQGGEESWKKLAGDLKKELKAGL